MSGQTEGAAKPKIVSFEGDEFFANPYPAYRELVDHTGPLVDKKTGAYLFARHSEVEALLRDPRFTKSTQMVPVRTAFHDSMLFQDPPDHTRTRRFMNEVFSGLTPEFMETPVAGYRNPAVREDDQERARGFYEGLCCPAPGGTDLRSDGCAGGRPGGAA